MAKASKVMIQIKDDIGAINAKLDLIIDHLGINAPVLEKAETVSESAPVADKQSQKKKKAPSKSKKK